MSIEVCSYLVDTNRQEECVYVVPHMRKQYVLCGIAGVSDKQFTIAFLSLTSVTKIAQK